MNANDFAEAQRLLRMANETLWTNEQVKAYWDSRDGTNYGAGMQQWLPEYDETHALLLDVVAAHLPPNSRVLDLGAGNGRVSKLILERFEDCHVVLVDLPSGMLKAAPASLSAFNERFEVRAGDIFDTGLDFSEDEFDCVVSVFAICHAHGTEVYEQLYRRIHRWLKPGGLFVCFDHVLGDSPTLTALNVANWHVYLQAHMPQQQVEDCIVSTYQEDAPLSLREHLDLLGKTGFQSADVIYKRDLFTIYAGIN